MAKIERRLVPIVSLDVEGYSRLTQLDEAATLSAVHHVFTDRVEATIGDHGGSVFKTMGDSVLAEFTSAVAAVEWVAQLQQQSSTTCLWRQPMARHCSCGPELSWPMSWSRTMTCLARGST